MTNLEDHFNRAETQERFAMLVSARVNQILSGKAQEVSFQPIDGIYTREQQILLFADLIARGVCAHLIVGEEK